MIFSKKKKIHIHEGGGGVYLKKDLISIIYESFESAVPVLRLARVENKKNLVKKKLSIQ